MAQIEGLRYDKKLDGWLPPTGDNRLRVWHSRSSLDLNVVWARDHTHNYPPHLHDCAELVWLHSGRIRLTCRGANYQLRSGDLCVIAPNELHSTAAIPPGRVSFTILHIPGWLYWSLIGEKARCGAALASEPLRILRFRSLGMAFNPFLESFLYAESDHEHRDLLTQLLRTIVSCRHSFATVRAEKALWHPAVVHAREVMSDRVDEAVNVSEIADEVGLNVRYFISLFKEGTGLPPHQYQIAMRVERARSMIQGTDSPLCDVALCTGFSDQSHLNRHFKRSYGFTPGTFKQILQPI